MESVCVPNDNFPRDNHRNDLGSIVGRRHGISAQGRSETDNALLHGHQLGHEAGGETGIGNRTLRASQAKAEDGRDRFELGR